MFEVLCPHCDAAILTLDDMRGESLLCSECGLRFVADELAPVTELFDGGQHSDAETDLVLKRAAVTMRPDVATSRT